MTLESPLLRAARLDSFTLLCQLLDAGEDPNQTNSEGETALILAVQRGFAKAVKRLLEAGADPLKNGGDITKGTCSNALNFAVHHGDWEIISAVMSKLDSSTYTGMLYANTVAAGFTRFIDRTCLEKLDVSCQPVAFDSLSPIFQAIIQNDLAAFNLDTDLHETLSNGLAPLHLAIALSRNEMVDLLLDRGVDINQTAPHYHYSPLFVAVHTQNKHAYRRLMDLGAQDPPSHLKHTALFAAVYWNELEIVKELIARGSDPKQYAQEGYCTLVYSAARFGLIGMLKYLLTLGLHPDWDPEGKEIYTELFYGSAYTALTAAALNGHVEVVEVLLNAGADPNRPSNGIPPLHFAMPCYRFPLSETIDYFALVEKYKKMIDLLIAHGAKIDAKCLIKAYATGQKEIAEHLVKCGAPADEKDLRGKIPCEYER
jgi:ankyrin repeat protein